MRKGMRILIAGAALAMMGECVLMAQGDAPRLRYGIEWSYTASFLHSYHNNYLSDVGERVDERGLELFYFGNGQALAHVGLEFCEKYSVALYSGYIGIKQERRAIPLTLRGSYFFNGYGSDGSFCFIDTGAALFNGDKNTMITKGGWGRRICLGHGTNLDISISAQLAYDHPRIFDSGTGSTVDKESLRRNDAAYGGINLTIGLNF